MIRDGTFPAGTLLPPERELMKVFGVGRASIREALFALNRMGLVLLRNGERPRVTTPTPETLITELSGSARHFLSQPDGAVFFQEARALFEVGIARLAAQRATAEDVERLRQALQANMAARGDLGISSARTSPSTTCSPPSPRIRSSPRCMTRWWNGSPASGPCLWA